MFSKFSEKIQISTGKRLSTTKLCRQKDLTISKTEILSSHFNGTHSNEYTGKHNNSKHFELEMTSKKNSKLTCVKFGLEMQTTY